MLQLISQSPAVKPTILLVSSQPVLLPWRPTGEAEQGVKELRRRGRQIVLVHPARNAAFAETGWADRVEFDPLTPHTVEALVARERPELVLPIPNDDSARELVADLEARGVLEAYGATALGPEPVVDHLAELEGFRRALVNAGLSLPRGRVVRSSSEAQTSLAEFLGPVAVRPIAAFGSLWSIRCVDAAAAEKAIEHALRVSPVGAVEITESPENAEPRIEVVLAGNAPSVDAHWLCSLVPGPSAVVAHPLAGLSHEDLTDWTLCLEGLIRDLGVPTDGTDMRFALDPYQRKLALLRGSASHCEVLWEIALPAFWQRGWFRACDGRLRTDPSIAIQRDLLQVEPGCRVLDIGTGGGVWTMEMAEAVGPQGQVIATDVDPAMVARVGWEAVRRGLYNVETRRVQPSDVGVPWGSVDRILISDVYLFNEGNLSWSFTYLEKCARALKPGGVLLVKHDKLITTAWVPEEGPRRQHNDLDAVQLIELSRPFFRLDALLPLRSHRPEPGQLHGFMLTLRKP